MNGAVVVDLDDTLVLEIDFVRSGFRAVADRWRARGLDPDDVERRCWDAFEASRVNVLDRVAAQLGLDDDAAADAVSTYRDHVPDLTLCPDADRFLGRVPRGRLAVVSDGRPETQSRKVDALRLRERVALVVLTGERDGWAKPSTLAFAHVLDTLDAVPGRSVYIADNASKDFAGARSVGMRTIHVQRPDGLYGDVVCHPDGRPDAVVVDLDAAAAVLDEWGLLCG